MITRKVAAVDLVVLMLEDVVPKASFSREGIFARLHGANERFFPGV